MKSANKTRKELIDELEDLRERVSELERHERNYRQALGNLGERTDQSFPKTAHMHDAIFVVFDRKLEFVNDSFAELFGISPEEACSSDFDPMTLIAPESRRIIREQYRQWCCGTFKMKQFNYIGQSKDGLEIECEAVLLFIPYKWGVAIQGTLRNISVSRRIDEAFQSGRSDMRFVLNAIPAGVLNADRDHLFMQASETLGKFDDLPIKHPPRVDYPVKPGNGNGL